MAYWCANFFLPHDKLKSALKGIIAAFCSANFVSDEKISTFSSVILLVSLHFLQFSAHSKSDTDEVAL